MPLLDRNGVAINVGDTVRLMGVVTALNPASTHYREVTMTVSFWYLCFNTSFTASSAAKT